MKKRSNIGHLVRIENTATGHREFIFLYILDDDPPNAYKTVIEGIRNLRLPVHLRKTAKIEADSVSDFTRVDRDFPDTIGSRMYNLPVTSFYRTKEKTFKQSLFLLAQFIFEDSVPKPKTEVETITDTIRIGKK